MIVSETRSVDAQHDITLHTQTRKTQPPPSTANSQLYSNDYLQASEWKTCLSLLQSLPGAT